MSCRDDDEVVKSPADSVERWTHDLYVEENQGPRTEEEKERVSSSYWNSFVLWVMYMRASLILGFDQYKNNDNISTDCT